MKRLVLIFALVATSSSGCAYLDAFLRSAEVAGIEPTFAFKNVSLTDASLGGLTLDTAWTLTNPNQVGITLDSVDYALFVEDKQVVAGSPPRGLQVAPNASTDLHFPASIKFQDLAQVVSTFLTKDSARYRVEGSIGVQTPIGPVRFPMVKQGEFEVPKVPQVAFGDPRVSNFSLAGVTVDFPVTVTNRNTYALPVSGITGAVTLAGQNVGTLSTGDLGAMPGKGTRTVNLPLQINLVSAGFAVANALRGQNAQVHFSAQVQSGLFATPLDVEQLVNLLH